MKEGLDMIIGIPKEILKGEKRVSGHLKQLKMIKDGHKVLVERNAGVDSFI